MVTYVPRGFFISALVFYVLNLIFPVPDMDQIDPIDLYGTFTEAEAKRAGVAPLDDRSLTGGISGRRSTEHFVIHGDKSV
jgi:NCS1 family nucleobase:cation symporter-1